MLLIASITDPIVEVAVDVVRELGLAGVFVLMLLESACIPVPSEATMLFAGFNVSEGEYSLFAATAVGSVANLVGSWLAYWLGHLGRVDLLEKHGRKLHVKKSHLEWADRWFERHGDATVFFTRMMPIIRTFISLPAGVAKMPFVRFSVLTFLGCLPWVFMLTFIGQQVGENWTDWKDSLHYFDYFVAACIVVGIGYLIVKRRRGGGGAGRPARRGARGGARARPAAHPARRAELRAAGDRRLRPGAPDRAAAGHARDGRRGTRARLAGDGRGGRVEQRPAAAGGGGGVRRAVPRAGAGLRAHAGRVAQRRDARGGAGARLRARGRKRALAPRRAAGHHRRGAAEGDASGAARPAGGHP